MDDRTDKFKKTCQGIVRSFSERISQMLPVNGDCKYIENIKVSSKSGGYNYVKSIAIVKNIGNRQFEIELYAENTGLMNEIESSLKITTKGSVTKKNNRTLGLNLPDINTAELERMKSEAYNSLNVFKVNINNQAKDLKSELGIKTGQKMSDEAFRLSKKIEEDTKKFIVEMEGIVADFTKRLQTNFGFKSK